jgi:hypothetical protein
MNLFFLVPVVLLITAVIAIYYTRRTKAGDRSGLGDRPDATEPRELRGSEQWKSRD